MTLGNQSPQNKGPKQDLGGITGDNKAQAKLDTDSQLWQQQQEMLTKLRQKLADLVRAKKMGANCDADIAATFRMLSGRLHIAEWDSLLPAFDAIQRLDASCHRAIIVFGGWHHSGDLPNLNGVPKDLVSLFRAYYGLFNIENQCHKVAKEGSQTWSDEVDSLIKWLATYRDLLPIGLWRKHDELLALINQKKPNLELEIENALLFVHPRIFAYSPTAKNPVAGWQDFYKFVAAYRRLVPKFHSEFGHYYWGIYLS